MLDAFILFIVGAEFGLYHDRPFLFGLQLEFKMLSCEIGCGGRYTINLSKECKWEDEADKTQAIVELVEHLNSILKDAKVNHVSQLKGKPVEITIMNRCFQDFRILTEVI